MIRVWKAAETLSSKPQTAVKVGSFLSGMKLSREEIQKRSFEAYLNGFIKKEER